MVQTDEGAQPLDLAVIGAGAAGTWAAHAIQRARPDWSVAIFERSDRVGGRLRSVAVPGISHAIELGGMRYLTSHAYVAATIDALGLQTRTWDTRGGPERTVLRGVVGDGPSDPRSGSAYLVTDDERGRSALDLTRQAFGTIVPGAETLDAKGWIEVRETLEYRGRKVTDWTIRDAVATVLSPEGHRLSVDAFGYFSGPGPFNAGDAIEYMTGSGNPVGEARVPVDGMDSMPRALARAFHDRGGVIHHGHQLEACAVEDGLVRLRFLERSVMARRVLLTMPIPALRAVVERSPALDTPAWHALLPSVESFPATKLYLWYERPWWRDGDAGVRGLRTTTDLPNRKVFYFDDEGDDGPAAVLAAYTDGGHTEPWVELAHGISDGAPASASMLARTRELLRAIHPHVVDVPEPAGSAFMHWGADPLETGWTFWSAGHRSDDVIARAPRPDPSLPIYVAGEAFSRAQAWVEGAFETAARVVDRILLEPPAPT